MELYKDDSTALRLLLFVKNQVRNAVQHAGPQSKRNMAPPPSGYKFQTLPAHYQLRGSRYSNFADSLRKFPRRQHIFMNMIPIMMGLSMYHFCMYGDMDGDPMEKPLLPGAQPYANPDLTQPLEAALGK